MAKVSVRVKKPAYGIRLMNPLSLPVRVVVQEIERCESAPLVFREESWRGVLKPHESVLIPVAPGAYEMQATIIRYDDVGNEVDLGDAGGIQRKHVAVLLSESDMAADVPLRSLGDMIQEMQKKEGS